MNHDFQELRLDAVTRRFAGAGGTAFNALSEMSLSIRRGEFIALLGPSGCGKSTALNCIAGLLPLSAGSIWLDDMRIDTLPPEQRGFGMVFQNYALFPHMTVAKNIGFGLKMAASRRRNHRPRRPRDEDGPAHRPGAQAPGQLSGGQQQRVAIARAIVIEPPLILMDEPLSNLDAKLRLETRAEIRRIHRELDRATIYVTHDQDEALSLADRIVVMKDGVVQQIASPQDVYAQPANLDVARFMGYRNVIELDVEREAGDQVTLAGPGIRLTGTRKQPLTGRRAAVAIRPEDIVAGEGPGENTLAGRIDNVEYCGRDSLVDIVVGDDLRLHVRTQLALAQGEQASIRVPASVRSSIRPGKPMAATTAPPLARAPFDRTLLLVVPGAASCCCCSSIPSFTDWCCRSSRGRGRTAQLHALLHHRQPLADDLDHAAPGAAGHADQRLRRAADRLQDARQVAVPAAGDHDPGDPDHPGHGADRRGHAHLSAERAGCRSSSSSSTSTRSRSGSPTTTGGC